MRLLRRIRGEGGYSLIETLVTTAILGTVMAAVTGLFVAGTRAEVDMNERYQAQQNARIALTKMRREVHCASSAVGQGAPNADGYYTHVLLTLASYCPTGNGQVSWCALSIGGAQQRHGLYRQTGANCTSSGVKWSDYLTSDRLFKPENGVSGQLAKLRLTFPIDLRPDDAQRSYRLTDAVVLRNSTRSP
ncbi:MAG TPA: type II secretion system protein [Gaiellaceae bacterium]|nr:type II secretion system protein [Gaiellaceae bacterium]